MQLETQELSRIQNQETPISKTNHRIKQEIAECTSSMEEQMHIRRQLEHMVRRLQTTQLRVNAHVQAMSKAVDESSREGDEVKLLCRQLEAGKARAVQFLQEYAAVLSLLVCFVPLWMWASRKLRRLTHRSLASILDPRSVQLQLQVERKARARELCDHEVRARNSQKMEAWRVQRVQERAEIAAELRGDLSAEEEARLLRSIESRERANEALHVANLTKSEKVADYEAVLSELKLAAGATSLEEVVEKLFAQGATTVSLEKEKAQAEARLIAARQEKEQAFQALNELKASGIGGIELNREVYNTLENEIQQAKATLKVNKSAFERLDGVITGIQQGSFGVAQRLEAFDDVLDLSSGDSASSLLGGAVGGGSSPPGAGAGARSEHMDSLALAELKLTKMLELVGQQNNSVNGFGSGFGGANADESEDGFEDGSSRGDLDDRNAPWSPTANSDPVLHRNNIRVRPGVPFSRQLQFEREDESLDSARSDLSTLSDASSDHADALVPSRTILKMSSSRHFSEVMRKKEVRGWRRVDSQVSGHGMKLTFVLLLSSTLDTVRSFMYWKLVEKQKVAAEKGVSDEEMLSKLRKRNQLEADARLSTSPTRPPASVGKDTKSFAFVTQLSFKAI